MSETNEKRTGGISVNTENIFPVIKKWLYSEKDIFLRELVSNATDAITKHKRLCSLGETTGDDTPYRIDVVLDREAKTITVQDNGIGMSEEVRARIFEKFFQGDPSHTVKGNGIGLNVVSRIIALAEGSIHVDSIPDKGSKFTIILP